MEKARDHLTIRMPSEGPLPYRPPGPSRGGTGRGGEADGGWARAMGGRHRPPAISQPKNRICCGRFCLDIHGLFSHSLPPTKGDLIIEPGETSGSLKIGLSESSRELILGSHMSRDGGAYGIYVNRSEAG